MSRARGLELFFLKIIFIECSSIYGTFYTVKIFWIALTHTYTHIHTQTHHLIHVYMSCIFIQNYRQLPRLNSLAFARCGGNFKSSGYANLFALLLISIGSVFKVDSVLFKSMSQIQFMSTHFELLSNFKWHGTALMIRQIGLSGIKL